MKDATHNGSYMMDPEGYFMELQTFLDYCLKQSSTNEQTSEF